MNAFWILGFPISVDYYAINFAVGNTVYNLFNLHILIILIDFPGSFHVKAIGDIIFPFFRYHAIISKLKLTFRRGSSRIFCRSARFFFRDKGGKGVDYPPFLETATAYIHNQRRYRCTLPSTIMCMC